jgi:hypothetical protein
LNPNAPLLGLTQSPAFSAVSAVSHTPSNAALRRPKIVKKKDYTRQKEYSGREGIEIEIRRVEAELKRELIKMCGLLFNPQPAYNS